MIWIPFDSSQDTKPRNFVILYTTLHVVPDSPPHSSSLILYVYPISESKANRVWPQSIKSNLETVPIPLSINLTQAILPLQSEKKSHTEKIDNNSWKVCSAAITLPFFNFFFLILLFCGP